MISVKDMISKCYDVNIASFRYFSSYIKSVKHVLSFEVDLYSCFIDGELNSKFFIELNIFI